MTGCAGTEFRPQTPFRTGQSPGLKFTVFCSDTTRNGRLTYLLTYSMEQSPWEANRFAASQKIPSILWNPKVHYRFHKCRPPVPILSQLDPLHTSTSHFLKIHLKIILPSTSGYPKRSLSLRFPHQNPIHTSLLPRKCYMPSPSHSSRFYHSNNIGWGVQIIKLFFIVFIRNWRHSLK